MQNRSHVRCSLCTCQQVCNAASIPTELVDILIALNAACAFTNHLNKENNGAHVR